MQFALGLLSDWSITIEASQPCNLFLSSWLFYYVNDIGYFLSYSSAKRSQRKERILVLFGLNTRKIPTFCRLRVPVTRKLIIGRNHEASQLIRQNGRRILFRLDTNSLSINISTGMSDFLFALQNDLDVWQQRWWGMYMHEIHLQNIILESYKTGKRLEIDFLCSMLSLWLRSGKGRLLLLLWINLCWVTIQ